AAQQACPGPVAADCSDCDKKFLQRRSPAHSNTYVENVAGQVRPLVRELWGLHDALCPGPRAKKATRESSCWLRRGDNCRRGAHRLVVRIADAVELGLGHHHHETRGGPVSYGPRSRARAPRQELALCARGWPRGGP